jgi:hypothetical protein
VGSIEIGCWQFYGQTQNTQLQTVGWGIASDLHNNGVQYTSLILFESRTTLGTSATNVIKVSPGHSYRGEALPGKWNPSTLVDYCCQICTREEQVGRILSMLNINVCFKSVNNIVLNNVEIFLYSICLILPWTGIKIFAITIYILALQRYSKWQWLHCQTWEFYWQMSWKDPWDTELSMRLFDPVAETLRRVPISFK